MSNEKDMNLYGIIKTIEFLEFGYQTGKIEGTEYNAEFRKLMHQFTMCKDSIPQFNLNNFFKKYQLDQCQTAKMRIQAGKSNY